MSILCQKCLATFWAIFRDIRQLFIPSSGHTEFVRITLITFKFKWRTTFDWPESFEIKVAQQRCRLLSKRLNTDCAFSSLKAFHFYRDDNDVCYANNKNWSIDLSSSMDRQQT